MADANDQVGGDFPIVGLGASAGGLEALSTFFSTMPANSGMAFVVVQHLSVSTESVLDDIIRRHTTMNVVSINQDMAVEPNHVYVLPEDCETRVSDKRFQVTPQEKLDGWPNTINRFFQSLALDCGPLAVAIILSGHGTDGTEGARTIKENGGLVIVQSPDSAAHQSMPSHVIDADLADVVLPPDRMPEYLQEHFEIDIPETKTPFDDLTQLISDDDLNKIVRRLRRQTGYDFGEYKVSTMRRQIARRMGANHLNTVSDYIARLDQEPAESSYLISYLLIHVTNFFRDAEAFESLKQNALLPLLQSMDIDDIFRAWVPGCASGEEAVSVAILIHECLKELDMQEMEVRIFATDINRSSIEQARQGVYPLSIAEHVSDTRLRENFIQHGDRYEIRNHISQKIVWAEHNLLEHPPFSKLHLISCRNVIIYFQPPLQERIMSLFQFALRPGGVLFLGSAETIIHRSIAFTAIDNKHKIYQRTSKSSKAWMRLDSPLFSNINRHSEQPMPATNDQQPEQGSNGDLEIIKSMLLEHYDSTCIIVDENYQVRYTFGDVDKYLRIVPGRAVPRNILEMAREGLQVELTIALDEAFAKEEIVVRPGAWVRTDGEERIINITVKSIHDLTTDNRHKLIIFEPMLVGQNLQDKAEESAGTEDNTVVRRLRQELRQTQESLQRVTQALQAKTEELSSSMEEIRSANEEVQTTNEELRTSKEELESMNEELNTLNAQLTDQNKELVRANDTQLNFLQSTEIGVIFVDQKLAIREYTQAAANVFSLRKSDIGRPLAEITSRLMYDDELTSDMISVLDTLVNVEKEVTTPDGRWFDFKIRPYRTTAHVIDGLVLTFNDITAQKQAQHQAEQTTAYMRDLLNTIDNGLLELSIDLIVVTANEAFYDMFQVEPEQTVGCKLYELGNGQWDIPELRRLLQEIIPEQTVVRDFVVRHDFPELGYRTMRLNARQVEALDRILLVITDVSEGVDEEAAS